MQNADKQVQELFEIVNKKKKEIERLEKPNWNTNCSFRYDKDVTNSVNLQVLSDVEALVHILGFLLQKEQAFNLATVSLGLSSLKFKWLNFTVEEWKNDIQLRIDKIQISEKRKELENYELTLNELISPELKRELKLKEIAKALKND